VVAGGGRRRAGGRLGGRSAAIAGGRDRAYVSINSASPGEGKVLRYSP
jgi:hypothetical protein